MALYQKAILEKYIKSLDLKAVQDKFEAFKYHFQNPAIQENIKKNKEEQYQEGFLTDLFVNILGYTKNPNENFNLTTELKNVKDAKKVDGAIVIDDKIVAVVELKSMSTTNLDSIENQAFSYKNNQVGCNYVITSNFQKIRLYIDNAVTHKEWDLFKISKEEFLELYLSLAYENIKSDLPKTIKDKSLSEQDIITKKLYKDYSNFKKELYQDLVKNNPDIDQLTLFKKAQKLLDRFLFLFFAEDRGLLQPQSVRTIVKRWNQAKELDLYHPLMDSYRKYFGYLNDGYQSKDLIVYAYNGGLFAPDEVLDKVIVSDEVLEINTINISDYDFESEVDVNILGHIFENSLNELEEIEAEIRGDIVEKTKTKRKKDGVFYTPKYITKYIVENTVGKLCEEKKVELQINEEDYVFDSSVKLTKKLKDEKKKSLDKLEAYRSWLLELTICDPACGSGAFLNQALEFLIEEHAYIDELQAKLFGDALVLTDIEGSILENNLYGVDINEESIEIAKLSLWLRTAEPNRKLTSLSNNLKSGNSLIDDPSVAGNKAFNWEQEFPHVFAKGGFDVIIGNPPYVPTEYISQNDKNYLEINYQSAYGRINLYPIFYELGIQKLRKNGFLSFITPYTILKNQYYIETRKFILNNVKIEEIIDFKNVVVFKDAAVDSIILTLKKCEKLENYDIRNVSNIQSFELSLYHTDYFKVNEILSKDDLNFNFSKDDFILKKLNEKSIIIKDIINFKQGIITGGNSKYITEVPNEKSVKFITGSDFNRYSFTPSNKFLTYSVEDLHRPRTKDIFEIDSKIILRQTAGYPIVTIDTEGYYTLDTVHNGKLINNDFDLKYILVLLNSTLLKFYYKSSINEDGKVFAQVKIIYIDTLPIKNISLEAQQPFIERADKMLALNKDLQNTSNKFSKLLASELGLTEPSKKLQEWYNLEFTDFAKELKKKKIDLSLAQKSEWMDFFEMEKQKINQIQIEIQVTDKEIDQMVYELYELTPEEIQIVENA